MRRLLFMLTSFSLIACGESFAEEAFLSDKIVVTESTVSVISSFETTDYFTTYGHGGNLIWEVPFNSKIVSWKMQEPYLFVFSKARIGTTFFLTCLDQRLGMLIWEKLIVAPSPSGADVSCTTPN